MPAIQARYWILTIPSHLYVPYLPPGYCHVQGQLETGVGGFVHWQLVVSASTKITLASVRATFGPIHAEPSRSDASRAYCWKEDTRVAGTQFELGELPVRRNSKSDWDAILVAARAGRVNQSPQIFKYVVITNCDALVQTMYNLCLWNEVLKYSGAELGLGKVVSHGKKQGSKLTLKIQEPNGGMDTWAKLTLSSMNSGEPLISSIYCDGLIGIQFVWRTKVDQCHCQLQGFGLRRTLIQGCGIRMWTQKQLPP